MESWMITLVEALIFLVGILGATHGFKTGWKFADKWFKKKKDEKLE